MVPWGLGAISVDSIYARSQLKGKDNEAGNTWRIRYNKSFELTDTSFTVASYQYSSAGYHSLPNVLTHTEIVEQVHLITAKTSCVELH